MGLIWGNFALLALTVSLMSLAAMLHKCSLGTRPLENRKEGLGDRLGSKCTERNVWNL